jgi:hypothetical protein
MDGELAHDSFLIEQLIRPVVNLYQVSALGPGGSPVGRPLAFARQKRLALREDIRFFADEEERRELFRLKAQRVIDVGGRYDVVTPEGERLGVLEHLFGRSLLRSTWRVLDPDEREVARAEEKSRAVALLRRAIDIVPYGELVPIPYHFAIAADGRSLGELRRQLSVRDRYTLDLTADGDRVLDRRVAVALAVALDALQSR